MLNDLEEIGVKLDQYGRIEDHESFGSLLSTHDNLNYVWAWSIICQFILHKPTYLPTYLTT